MRNSVDVRTATIAAVAALAGAALGAIVAGTFTLAVANRQIDAEVEQGLREQRRAAYTTLLQDEEAVIKSENDFWNLFRNNVSGQYPARDEIAARKEEMKVAMDKMGVAGSVIDLIGTDDSSRKLNLLRSAHLDFYNAADLALASGDAGAQPERTLEIEQALDSAADKVEGVRYELVEALRYEVDIP